MLRHDRRPGWPRGILRFPMLCAATFAVVAGNALADFARSFDAAIAHLKATVGLVNPGFIGGVGLSLYRTEAENLVRSREPGAAKLLRAKVTDPDIPTASLASLTLALMADHPDAATELGGHLRDTGFGGALAVTYAPASVALRIADEAWAVRGDRPEGLRTSSTLYRFFGDADRAAAMDAELKGGRSYRLNVREQVVRDVAALRQRLAQPPELRPAWLEQDLAVWRAIWSMPPFAGLTQAIHSQARAIRAETRTTPAYLKDRIGAPDLDHVELKLLVTLAVDQPDAAFAPELAALIEDDRSGIRGEAMTALLAVGRRDALARVERLIAPPKIPDQPASANTSSMRSPEASRHEQVVAGVSAHLAVHGDPVTLDLLTAWANDPAFPTPERAALAKARSALQKRLTGFP